MNRRNPPLKYTLPDVIDPVERVCFTIEVPKNIYHIGAFRGAIMKLASAIFWQDDAAHTAKQVALVWRNVYDNIRLCSPCENGQGILLEDFMSQQIRISPDDNCVIQMWCIDHWEDWYDPRTCVPQSLNQPTNGTGLDEGDCREWDVLLNGNSRWLVPVSLSEGDTIEISGATGAWSDGTLQWNCTDGSIFGLGACVSGGATSGGDPLPTVWHMRLIAAVDSAFYDAYNTTIAVGSGLTDVAAYIQANDASLADNDGSIAFHVRVCKLAVPASPITISYTSGAGVTSLDTSHGETSWIISVASTLGAGAYAVNMTFSEAIKLTVQTATGYVALPPACSGVFAIENLSGVLVEELFNATNSQPTEFTPRNTVNQLIVSTGVDCGGVIVAPFSMQLKVEKL